MSLGFEEGVRLDFPSSLLPPSLPDHDDDDTARSETRKPRTRSPLSAMARTTITSPTTSFTSSFLGGSTTSTIPALTDPNDPFYVFLRPPPGETPEQRVDRERKEAEARKVNDEIDEMLRAEKSAMKKRKKPVKVLLLGQSESGACCCVL